MNKYLALVLLAVAAFAYLTVIVFARLEGPLYDNESQEDKHHLGVAYLSCILMTVVMMIGGFR